MSDKVKAQIKSLNKEVLTAQDAYYSGNPIMTDAEYDALEMQLRSIVNQYPQFSPIATVLSNVGNTFNSTDAIPHAKPMLSIENYYTEESFVEAAKSYGAVLLIEPKRDGNSCELTYENGVLVRAVSRGDGKNGEDMTAQVKSLKRVPKKITTNISDLRIRGEMVMSNTELVRINKDEQKDYANARNLVAGSLKQKDLSIVANRDIVLIPWDVYSPTEDAKLPDSSFDRMKLVESFGFTAYEGVRIHRKDAGGIVAQLHRILKNNEVSDIVADGVVIKTDSQKLRNQLGVASKFTNYQHCFKPQNLATTTDLVDIEYGLGRTGKVTPVAILKPVNLGGAMVSRASVCNETFMAALGLKIGCVVSVVRSGDVIPYINSVVDTNNGQDIVFPTHCPSCNSLLRIADETDKVQRYCDNSACPGKAAEHFYYIANRDTLEIDCLGSTMAEELVSHKITSVADLFELADEVVTNQIPASGEKTMINVFKTQGFRSGVNTLKMCKSLDKAKTAKWDRWIASLNIPFIGHSLGEDIAKELLLDSEDMKTLPNLLLTVPYLNMEKLGTVKTAAIVEWARNPVNVKTCERLYDAGVRPTALETKQQSTTGSLAGTVICMTGELSMGTRKEVGVKLEALGAEIVDDVRSTCNLMIVGDKPGSKLQKAQKKGIKIVDESWVKQTLCP